MQPQVDTGLQDALSDPLKLDHFPVYKRSALSAPLCGQSITSVRNISGFLTTFM